MANCRYIIIFITQSTGVSSTNIIKFKGHEIDQLFFVLNKLFYIT